MRDTFHALIESNTALENIQKFYYLKSCLHGNAAQILQSLEISADNYTIAWDLLKARFENKRLLTYHHIQALFELNPIGKESAIQLRKLIDDTQKYLRALQSLGEPIDSWDSLIIHMVASRLDNVTGRKWESSLHDDSIPELKSFIQFLSRQCAILETLQPAKLIKNPVPPSSTKKGENVTSHVTQGQGKGCVLYQGQQALYNCTTFKGLSIDDKRKEVKRHRCCFNCLRTDHMVGRCLAGGCRQCGKRHDTLLHISDLEAKIVETHDKTDTPSIKSDLSAQSTGSPQVNLSIHSGTQSQSRHNNLVLLATAPVIMYDKVGESHRCRAFLDAGYQINIITRSLCRRLQLIEYKSNASLSGIGCIQANILGSVQASIHSIVNEFNIKLPFMVMECITEPMPAITLDKKLLKIPENIKIATFPTESRAM